MSTIKETGMILAGDYKGYNFVLCNINPFTFPEYPENESNLGFYFHVHPIIESKIDYDKTLELPLEDVVVVHEGTLGYLKYPVFRYTGSRYTWRFPKYTRSGQEYPGDSTSLETMSVNDLLQALPNRLPDDKVSGLVEEFNNGLRNLQNAFRSLENQSNKTFVTSAVASYLVFQYLKDLYKDAQDLRSKVSALYEQVHTFQALDNESLLVDQLATARNRSLLDVKISTFEKCISTLESVIKDYGVPDVSKIPALRRV